MSFASTNSLVNLGSIKSNDPQSPFTPAAADVGSTHPLDVPKGAKGLVAYSLGAAGDLAELAHNTTKGRGMVVPPGRTVFAFDTDMEGASLFINLLVGTTPMPSIYIHYYF